MCPSRRTNPIHRSKYHSTPSRTIPRRWISFGRTSSPRANTKMLLAPDDVGRGCLARCSPLLPLCVLKFGNESNAMSARLAEENKWWDRGYPQCQNMIKVEVWGGLVALMMLRSPKRREGTSEKRFERRFVSTFPRRTHVSTIEGLSTKTLLLCGQGPQQR